MPRLAPAVIENRLAEWRRLLRASTTQGRAVLQRVLRGRIVFTPSGKGYTFEAPTRFDKLFSEVVVPKSVWSQPAAAGTEHIRPEDVYPGAHAEDDLDSRRLLESVCGKWSTSPRGVDEGSQWQPATLLVGIAS